MADSNPQIGSGDETEKMCWQCGRTFTTSMEVCPDDGARLIETDLEEQDDPLIGSVFDERFRIYRKLGEGGMGAVYSARRLDFETTVALKLLKLDFTSDEGIRKRFMYEARVISNLKHPHAIQVFDFGQTSEGHVYMVMELLDGESLADRLAYRFVTYREVFDIIPPICGVLGEAHTRDVIHRDLKPENIFLLEVDGNEEFPKLLDFGIAKHNRAETMTKSGTLWGTPAYMSPEQARGSAVGAPADIYGVGVMLFELITGNLPFNASTQMGYAVKHIKAPVRAPSTIPGLESIPPQLDEFIVRLLAKDPGARPESMEVVADTLEEIAENHFDDQLLDSIPAKEVDPIQLQRWLDEAPEVSEEMPDELLGGEESSEDLAETADFDNAETARMEASEAASRLAESFAEESDDEFPDTDENRSGSSSSQPLDDSDRDTASKSASRTRAADVETEIAGSETIALHDDQSDTEEQDEDASDRQETNRRHIIAVTAVAAVLIGIGFVLLPTDGTEQSVGELDTPEVSVDDGDTAPTDGESEPFDGAAAPIDANQAVSAAASHASTVLFNTVSIAGDIEPAELQEDIQQGDFSFLHQPLEEEHHEEPVEQEETDDQRQLREALEQTF